MSISTLSFIDSMTILESKNAQIKLFETLR